MSGFKFTIDEAEYNAIVRKLDELAKPEQAKAIKTALRREGNVIIAAGKSSFKSKNKSKTGNLYRSFTSKMKRKNTGTLIGFRRGKRLGNHAHLIDKGTVDRYTKRGAYRGRIDRPDNGKRGKTFFWSDVVQVKGPEAIDNLMNAVYDAVEEIKRRS